MSVPENDDCSNHFKNYLPAPTRSFIFSLDQISNKRRAPSPVKGYSTQLSAYEHPTQPGESCQKQLSPDLMIFDSLSKCQAHLFQAVYNLMDPKKKKKKKNF